MAWWPPGALVGAGVVAVASTGGHAMSRHDEILVHLGRLLAAGWRVMLEPSPPQGSVASMIAIQIELPEVRRSYRATLPAAVFGDVDRLETVIRGLANVAGVNGRIPS